ncbi:TauD/TfdA family dioxygenase [Phytohabitans sp. ZYX-F-186]|uniref:TauD/TfdA family dioxygenase n=1 Tax=Phytohabitans maris TaxID=3071409 RepID=A0ABU0ZKI6_9ACTN|nr:TauD/TfdA family dioxygenase [Phytohabitans sp. ZYX-F-186]MDQ7907558.1 TauD/TfdA family dioxygenase [Phytohabitans sp. ZYX-F-186]
MTTTTTQVRIVPRTPNFGARVEGLDAREELDADTIAQLKEAILKYKVLFFREQNLNEEQHARFAGYFGEPFEHNSNFDMQYEDAGLSNVTVVPHFHSDVMYMTEQPGFAMLQMLTLPDVGGDTMWADLVSSYDALSEPIKKLIDPLTVINVHPEYFVDSQTLSDRYEKRYGKPLTPEQIAKRRKDLSPTESPLVRVIPETGCKNYYISAWHTMQIKGLPKDESDAILNLLYSQQLKPEYVIRWEWTVGDIAFWDHRTTLHAGVNDYAAGAKRHGRRANIGVHSPVPSARAA